MDPGSERFTKDSSLYSLKDLGFSQIFLRLLFFGSFFFNALLFSFLKTSGIADETLHSFKNDLEPIS